MSQKSHHATNLVNLQRSIARHLHRGEPVPPGKAQALASLLAKEQRAWANCRTCGDAGSCDETSSP
jgi:hypothetical protein